MTLSQLRFRPGTPLRNTAMTWRFSEAVGVLVCLMALGITGCNRAEDGKRGDAETRRGEQGAKAEGRDGAATASDSAAEPVLRGHSGSIAFVAFSGDGKRVLTGSSGKVHYVEGGELKSRSADDKTARVWDAVTRKELGRLEKHQNEVACGALSHDGAMAATAEEKTIYVWSVGEKAEVKHTLDMMDSEVTALSFSRDGKRLATGTSSGDILTWNLEDGNPLGGIKGEGEAIRSIALSGDGKFVIAVRKDGASIIELAESKLVAFPSPEGHEVAAAAFTGDSKAARMLMTYRRTEETPPEQGIQIFDWNTESGEPKTYDSVPVMQFEVVALAHDASNFLVGGMAVNGQMGVSVYQVGETQPAHRFDVPHAGGMGPPTIAAVAPGGKLAAVGTYRSTTSKNESGEEQELRVVDAVSLVELK